jgi:oxygen-independent coproporphyrinogen-3 oxidase
VHVPFCASVCFYCACNKVVTGDRLKAEPYLEHLEKEMRLQSSLVDPDRTVTQLHWGGGTPTFLNDHQLRDVMRIIRASFRILDDDSGEYSIEIDPRELREYTLAVLRGIGFNRISFGVQDFDPEVQKAIHRFQPEEITVKALTDARGLGFRSINIDLMYGLPLQTVERFSRTLDKVVGMRPDRLSVFNYAHLPHRFKPQRRIDEADLPTPDQKLEIMGMTIERLTSEGYQYIGMDHFALVDDELSVAQRNGSLHRTFQGYSTHANTDLIAMGLSAISAIDDSYTQNHVVLEDYYRALDAEHLPVYRGYELNDDDRLRAEVIQRLVCHGVLDTADVENRFGIDFEGYFGPERERLSRMADDGLVELRSPGIQVTPRGRLLIRHVCKVFDRYRNEGEAGFSKMI